MKFRRIKHTFLRLSTEEKAVLFGGLFVLIGAFLPWYQVNLNIKSEQVTANAFSGDIGVIGFTIFLITLLALIYLVAEHMNFRMPTFKYKKEGIILFLMAESAFLLMLTTVVYMQRSFDYTEANLRFGLYLALIGAIVATFSSYAVIQKMKKQEVEAFFDHPEETGEITYENDLAEPEEEELPQEEPAVLIEETMEPEEAQEEAEEVEEPEIEMVEEVEIEEELEVPDEPEEEEMAEEASEAAEEEMEEERGKRNTATPSMGFYED